MHPNKYTPTTWKIYLLFQTSWLPWIAITIHSRKPNVEGNGVAPAEIRRFYHQVDDFKSQDILLFQPSH